MLCLLSVSYYCYICVSVVFLMWFCFSLMCFVCLCHAVKCLLSVIIGIFVLYVSDLNVVLCSLMLSCGSVINVISSYKYIFWMLVLLFY